MDKDMARVLFDEGATFVFLDVPPGMEFGIDYNSWTVGPKFKGVKMIPPGIHYIYYSAQNRGGQTAPRTGFFYNFKHREMLVRKWDQQTEDINDEVISEDELERFHSNKQELDRYLGPYPYETYKNWVSLTNHLSAELLSRLEPKTKRISSVTEFESKASTTQSRAAEKAKAAEEGSSGNLATDEEDARLPVLKMNPENRINFTDCKIRFPESSSAAELSQHNIDLTYTLDQLITHEYSGFEDILGEIQFSFVCFLIGQVYDAFEQWKKLVHLLCTCETALGKYPQLYKQFINILHFQLLKIPEDFFVDIVSRNNFLTSTLQEFFSNLEESNVAIEADLRSKGLRFRDYLTRKFNWDFTSEPDDFAPVVVDLPE